MTHIIYVEQLANKFTEQKIFDHGKIEELIKQNNPTHVDPFQLATDIVLHQSRDLFKQKKPVKKIHRYFTTFTCKDRNKIELLRKLVNNIPNRKYLDIIRFESSEENIDSNFHIHTYYESQNVIKKNRFQYIIKQCGFVDHKKVKKGTEDQVLSYIYKEKNLC